MITLNRLFTASLLLAGLTLSTQAQAYLTCGYNKVEVPGAKLRPRNDIAYVLLGNNVLSRFDTKQGQTVHFYQRNATPGTQLPLIPQDLGTWDGEFALTKIAMSTAYLGSDKGDWLNGHVKKRFTPTTTGPHDVIAAFTKDIGHITGVMPLLCVVHRYNVHGVPTLRENSVNETTLSSGDVRFEANLRVDWAAHSQAAHTNKSKTITWHKLTQCLDSGRSCINQNTGWQHQSSVQSNQVFSTYLMPGRYTLRATINDGVSTVTKTYSIDNSNSIDHGFDPLPPCDRCQIP
ncbi:MAG: hypothetical protein KKE94_16970 [Gammaproteobacteria bacterium]|nr:hypothetical protein [Gammaproteobacteria bacterium]